MEMVSKWIEFYINEFIFKMLEYKIQSNFACTNELDFFNEQFKQVEAYIQENIIRIESNLNI